MLRLGPTQSEKQHTSSVNKRIHKMKFENKIQLAYKTK